MSDRNISLPDTALAWIEEQIRSGRYRNARAYLCALIRQDRERTARIAAMQRLVDEALSQEPLDEFDLDAFLARMHAGHGGEAG